MALRKNIAVQRGLRAHTDQPLTRIAYGIVTLVNGAATLPAPEGFSQNAVITASHLVIIGVAGVLSCECDGVDLSFASTEGANDDSTIQWILVE